MTDDSGVSNEITFETVLKTALNLLSASRMTTGRLRQKLSDRGYPGEFIDAALDYCTEKRYLDDGEFIQRAVEKLLRKLYGPRKIRLELNRLGFASELIETLEFDDVDFVEICLEFLGKHGKIDEFGHIDQRLFAASLRAGFTTEQVRDALRLYRQQQNE